MFNCIEFCSGPNVINGVYLPLLKRRYSFHDYADVANLIFGLFQ